MKLPSSRFIRVVASSAVGTFALVGCAREMEAIGETATVTVTAPASDEPEDAEVTDDVRLVVSSRSAVGEAIAAPAQIGRLDLVVSVVSRDGGVVRAAEGREGLAAFELPSFIANASDPPRAVIAAFVESGDEADDSLSPGSSDFSFGAEFRKDELSSGTSVDNGDNILQRGLASDSSQFKMEIDRGQPSCTVKGNAGSVTARADIDLDSDHWYEVRCSRIGETVEVYAVEHWEDGGMLDAASVSTGPIGDVVWDEPMTPLAVGGKLSANAQVIRSATDQFNGLIATAWFTKES